MKTYSALLVCLFCSAEVLFAQQLKASEVLERAIAYHDPNGNWETFNTTFQVTMTTPNNAARVSDITINLPDEFFKLVATRDGNKTSYTLDKTKCTTCITDSITQPGTRTPCETAMLYKNHYT